MNVAASSGRGLVAWAALAAVMCGGVSGAAAAHGGSGTVRARAHGVTVTASALRAGPDGTLTTALRVSSTRDSSDQLDAATVVGGATATVYHQKVSVGELPDLAGCGGERPTPDVVDRWLHEGPLLVPSRAGGHADPAAATLTVQPAGAAPASGATVAVTLYFADAGPLVLDLPVESG